MSSFTRRCFLFAALTAAMLCMLSTSMVAAEPSPSTFVRGMMAADQQFGLYMALSETNRGGGGSDSGLSVNDESSQSTSSDDGVGPVVSRAVDQAREAAISFVDTVRRRAFVPPQPKRQRM
jgi:hypothetical protein